MPEVSQQSKAQRLANLVEAEAGVEIMKLPRHQAYAWFPIMTALEAQIRVSFLPELTEETKALIERERKRLDKAIRPTLIARDKIWPLPSVSVMHVFEIFSDADEVRVYAFGEEVPEGVEGTVGQPTRYRLSKSAMIYGSEVMTEERWVSEVANEWVEVDAEVDAGEIATLEERAAVIDFLKDQIEDNENYSVRDAIDDLKDEVHLVEPDEEEEEEEVEETAAITPKSLPAVAALPTTVSTGTAQT